MRKTSAWPLVWVYILLIVYASLYPFSNWRHQGVMPWEFLWGPLPQYWTAFDLASNVLGYVPLGFLLALADVRGGGGRHAVRRAVLTVAAVSLLMETLQGFLPSRVPSNVDFVLNVAGGSMGAASAHYLQGRGVATLWDDLRARWFMADARTELVLLGLWPVTLLFPAPVPLGLGQIYERLEGVAASWLADSAFIDWLPVRALEFQALQPVGEVWCVALGGLIPMLLAFMVVDDRRRRLISVLVLWVMGIVATALSAVLSYGAIQTWGWVDGPVQAGFGLALLAGLLSTRLTSRHAAMLLGAGLLIYLALINQASTNVYFQQTLESWQQGRFTRFHGVTQWLGWLWPYLVFICAVRRMFGGRSKIGA